jgi:predicted amidohydrolase
VCLPELILAIGTPAPFDPDRVHAAALPVPGPWLAPFQDVARAYHMGICFSVYERAGTAGEIVYNTAVLLGRDGAVVGTQRKVHLALREARAGVAAGHELAVQTFDGVTLGMAICMDSTPPETARVLARQGAEILLVPTEGDFRATPWARGTTELHEPRWKAIHVAHALDNAGDRALLWADVDLDALGPHPLGASVKDVLWSMRRPHAYWTLASWP